ncbi:hypothetical protein [Xenophilus sp. Marseille-Q4582]|uniref:hypothetical protein n=1 Tax=Xenophilus sp. Marseille-Q4582 TaxID=2866600 RepID=UPI001CE3BE80|nr:hypothetical protein [Xenophilus sp. Marseille-Q4582]
MVSRSSLLRLLAFGRAAEATSERDRLGMERVRARMLQLLARHEGAAFYRVAERIRYADEMESLWYLRQDLMAALSEVHGEVAARDAVEPLHALFKGLLPAALTAAPARPRVPS